MRPGDVVDRFELRQRLGEGGMGRVFLAWDAREEREVALKLVALDGDPQVLENEQRGAILQARLCAVAPEVAAVHEYGQADGHFFVAMEYVAGKDLVRELEGGKLPLERTLTLMEQLASFLAKAHSFQGELDGATFSGVVHADLKPENIRLQDGDLVRLFDFGTAQVLSREHPRVPLLFGTYPYTAPERLVDDGLADRRADVWAAGILLYQMIAGRLPYQAHSEEELKEKILSETPARLPDDCPKPLRKIVQLCLAREPERRYPSASELLADLEAFRAGRMVVADVLESSSAKTQRTTRRRTETGVFIPPIPGAAPSAGYPPPPPPLGNGAGAGHGEYSSLPYPPLPAGYSSTPLEAKPGDPGWQQLLHHFSGYDRRQWLALGAAVVAAGLITTSLLASSLGRRMVDDLHRGRGLDAALARYHQAETWSFFGLGLGTARAELTQALDDEVDRIFADYRQEDPTIRQGDWERADQHLQTLQELAPSDRVDARKAYCHAHLDRLRAATLRAKGEKEEARSALNDSIFGFEKAAKLEKRWADPHLGLARIYAYDIPDLAKLRAALDGARERGHAWSRRETAQLADGYRSEGEALWARSKKLRDSQDREQELLGQAEEHLRQAIEIYDQVIDYARSATNKRAAMAVLRLIEGRLAILEAVREAQAETESDGGFFF